MLTKPFGTPAHNPLSRRSQVGAGSLGVGPAFNPTGLSGDPAALAQALRACMANGSCAPGAGGAGGAPDLTTLANMIAAQSGPQRCRRTLLPLAKVPVAATSSPSAPQTGSGAVTPQYNFRGLRLIVPTEISAQFDLVSLKVNSQDQLATVQSGTTGTSAAVPGRVFDQTAQDSGFIDMDWASPTAQINYIVANKLNAPFVFEGAFEGIELR